MYAVIDEEDLVFLGNCHEEAIKTLDIYPDGVLYKVASLEELEERLDIHWDEDLSEEFETITEKLTNLGFDKDFTEKLRTNSERLVGEVKSLGIKGMKTVGEGFIALGELLNKTANEQDQ